MLDENDQFPEPRGFMAIIGQYEKIRWSGPQPDCETLQGRMNEQN